MQLKEGGFVEKVRRWWDSCNLTGSPNFILAKRLKYLKLDLKNWNMEVFGNVDTNKKVLLEQLQLLDNKGLVGGIFSEEKMKKKEVIVEIEKLSLIEEISWKKNFRILWMQEGDNYTKFFHKMTNSHRRFNSFKVIQHDDNTLYNKARMKDHIVTYFTKLFSEDFS